MIEEIKGFTEAYAMKKQSCGVPRKNEELKGEIQERENQVERIRSEVLTLKTTNIKLK